MNLLLLVLSLLLSAPLLGHAQLFSLIEAEKSFAKASAEKGTKAAFLEYLHADAVLFRRGIVNGRKFWKDAPDATDKLTWEPQYADISAGGDFGFTTGPFKQFQHRSDANPAGGGHYLSVWQKQYDSWSVLFDGGIGHPPADLTGWETQSTISTLSPNEQLASSSKPTVMAAREIVTKREHALREAFKLKGAAAFTEYLSTEARLYRPRKAPYRKANISELLAETDKAFTYEAPADIRVAPYGDMAFSYGNVTIAITSDGGIRQLQGNYLRIWKREYGSEWKIVADMVSL